MIAQLLPSSVHMRSLWNLRVILGSQEWWG